MKENKKYISKKIVIIISAIAIILIAAIFIFFNKKEEVYRSIKVIQTEGTCTIEREAEAFEAYLDMQLQSEDKASTDVESRLYLKLDEDKVVSLEPESSILLRATGNVDTKDTKTQIILEKGSIYNEIQNPLGEAEAYEVVTPNVVMSVRGTQFLASTYLEEDINVSKIEVTKGKVQLADPINEESTVMVDAGYMLEVKEGDDLASLEPWPIDSIIETEEEPAEETNVIAMPIALSDFMFDSTPVTSGFLDDMIARNNITVPMGGDPIVSKSPDDIYYLVKGLEGNEIEINTDGDGWWIALGIKEGHNYITTFEMQPEALKQRYSAPIKLGQSVDEIKAILNIDGVSGNEGIVKFTDLDTEYIFREHDNWISIFKDVDTTGNRVLTFLFKDGKLDDWTCYSID